MCNNFGGVPMKDFEAWKLFEATGNPQAFMIYSRERDRNKNSGRNDIKSAVKGRNNDIVR